MLSFAAPLWLALGIPLVLVVALRLRALPASHTGARRRLVQATMFVAALAAALAIARLELATRIDRVATIFVLDRSRSVENAGEDAHTENVTAIREALEGMREDDLAGLVVFGAEAATEILPQPRPQIGRSTASIARDGTDIDTALRRALADLPASATPHIVLLSDGVETSGDALAAAQIAGARGVTIDTFAIERASSAEVAIDRVIVPPTADPDEPVDVRIVTRATRETDVRVRVRRDGQLIAETTTRIDAGSDALSLRDRTSEAGVHRYDVEIEPLEAGADVSSENNVAGGFLRITGRSRVLVLSDRPAEAEALVTAIRAAGPDVISGDRLAVPLTLAELASFDLIVLSDLNARSLTDGQMSALRAYVRDLGGGLLMLGARDAFGLGGYAYTPVEEVLPATFDLRQRRDRASLAMVIAIDKSGSMTVEVSPGVMKLDLANEAAARSAALLSPMDRLAVEHVDTEITWTLPMVAVDQPEALGATIRRAAPGGGGIFVDVALGGAYAQLRAQDTQLKHFLLFSDGSDSEEMTHARQLVTDAARDGITTSVVSMGNGPDTPELEVLSRLGGGRFYIVENMTELPRIFTQETITASRSALVEEPFHITVGGPADLTRGIDFASAPMLDGYVVVNARPRATVVLGARRESAEGDDALLATWRTGVGQSGIFTTDGGGHYGRSWLGWPGYAPLFGQLARSLSRAPERHDAQLDVEIEGSHGSIRVEAMDDHGRFRNHLDLLATISAPGGTSQQVALEQTGPGRYEAAFDGAAPGSYLVTVRELGDDGEGSIVGSAGLVRGRGDELRGEGTDHALLSQIAAATGGSVRTSLRELFLDRPAPTYAHRELWRELLLASMWLLLLSVALRRFVLPERVRALLARLSRRPQARTATTDAGSLATLDALRARRARSTGGTDGEAKPRELAPEVARAASSHASAPASAPRDEASHAPPPPDEPPPPSAPAPPSSLAENLLQRRAKKKR
ncbi:MAG: VWA domain-containing protein [Sandaracinus sp.]